MCFDGKRETLNYENLTLGREILTLKISESQHIKIVFLQVFVLVAIVGSFLVTDCGRQKSKYKGIK